MKYLRTCIATAVVALSYPAIASAQSLEGDVSFPEAIRDYAQGYEQLGAFQGVILVARGDQIVFHESFGQADYNFQVPMRNDARFRIASLSKQFTQAAIGRLADRGLLRLDDRLSRFLPQFPRADEITIFQLLDGSSGIKDTNTVDWLDMHEPMSLDEIVANLANEPLDFDPGSRNNYSNGAYAVAAAVIEVASGLEFGEFIEREFARGGYPSVGHESPFAVVPNQAQRYAPGPVFGERVQASEYLVANRYGGGSLYADASDVYRFFRDTFRGEDMSQSVYEAIFKMPADGDTLITGRSSGTLAQVYYDINDDLTVVMLSSNTSWPGGFTSDLVEIVRGNTPNLQPIDIDPAPLSAQQLNRLSGDYVPERFRWTISLRPRNGRLIWQQDELAAAFARMSDGSFYLPLWDWLCRFTDDDAAFTCRPRDPDSSAEFIFRKSDETER